MLNRRAAGLNDTHGAFLPLSLKPGNPLKGLAACTAHTHTHRSQINKRVRAQKEIIKYLKVGQPRQRPNAIASLSLSLPVSVWSAALCRSIKRLLHRLDDFHLTASRCIFFCTPRKLLGKNAARGTIRFPGLRLIG